MNNTENNDLEPRGWKPIAFKMHRKTKPYQFIGYAKAKLKEIRLGTHHKVIKNKL